MSIFKEEYWFKFKQEFFSILFLSIAQLYLNYYFPAYIKLGNPLRTISWIIASVSAIFVYIIAFSSAHKYSHYLDLEDFNFLTHTDSLRKIIEISLLLIVLLTFYFLWHIDFHDMSDLNYAILYAHHIIAFGLFYRAVYRQPSKI